MPQLGWNRPWSYCDHVISDTSSPQPGVQELLRAVSERWNEIVLAEAFDRLARD